jgi:hypothetical protein
MPTLYQYISLGVLFVALIIMVVVAKKCWKDFNPKEDK